ncbi:MAG: hypothetical protein MMC33_000110 [Icmadophila ericetorum]|nr:hypothetical protein [Icmadophila ericetorum]
MAARANAPILPNPHPTKSYWQDPPSWLADYQSCPMLPEADYIVVGSGISGASIAYKLISCHPNAKVVMLEARQFCSGATGRGHIRAGRFLNFHNYCTTYGVDSAIKLAKFETRNVHEIQNFITKRAIPCDLNPCEGIDIFFEEDQFQDALAAVNAMEKHMTPTSETSYEGNISIPKVFTGTEAVRISGVANAIGVILTTGHASVSGYKFVVGLTGNILSLLSTRFHLECRTPVTSITPYAPHPGLTLPNRHTVHTPRGSVSTPNLIIATNAFTPQLFPSTSPMLPPLYHPLSKFIHPCRAQILASAPSASLILAGGLSRSYNFMYTSPPDGAELDYYMICRPSGSSGAGDVILGGGRAGVKGREEGIYDDGSIHVGLAESLKTKVGDWFSAAGGGKNGVSDDEIKGEWTGIMGFTGDGFPVVGEINNDENEGTGIFVSAGFNGHGMAYTWLCAEALVQMIDGKDDGELRGWFPDEMRLDRIVKRRGTGGVRACPGQGIACAL